MILFFFENQGYDFIEKVSDSTVSANDHEIDISEEMHVKKPDENDSLQNPFEDNRFIDHVNDHFMNSAAANYFEQQNEHFADDEPELPNKIDFAEKENYSKYLFLKQLSLYLVVQDIRYDEYTINERSTRNTTQMHRVRAHCIFIALEVSRIFNSHCTVHTHTHTKARK